MVAWQRSVGSALKCSSYISMQLWSNVLFGIPLMHWQVKGSRG